MSKIIFFALNIATMLVLYLGPIAAFFLSAFWAYNVAQRGDSFGYALFTFFGNLLVLQLAVAAAYWVLTRLIMGTLMLDQKGN